MSEEKELPQGWVGCELDDLTSDISYGYTAKASDQPVGPRMLRITDMQDNRVDWLSVPFCQISEDVKAKYLLKNGDLVFARTGATVGKSFLINGDIPESVYASYLIRVRCSLEVMAGYLSHYFRSPDYWEQITEFSAGIGQPNVNGSKLKGLTVLLPPLNEQKRIADKLDAVLARVDACRERLDRIPAILKRFRQSVLAAATSGKLTEEWREGCNLSCKDWQKLSLGEVVREVKNGLSPKPNEELPGTPILRISSVRPFSVSFKDIRYLPTGIPVASYLLQRDDLLFTRYNGTREFVGVCGRVKDLPSHPVVYPDKLIRVRTNEERALAGFIEIATSAPSSRDVIEELAKTSAGQTGISGRDLKGLRITLPSLREQREIVRRVESLFAYADRLETRYTAARAQVERLTPALLSKAFRGELVPQDPSDEPASVLLERIHALGVGRNKRSVSGNGDRREQPAAPSTGLTCACGTGAGRTGLSRPTRRDL